MKKVFLVPVLLSLAIIAVIGSVELKAINGDNGTSGSSTAFFGQNYFPLSPGNQTYQLVGTCYRYYNNVQKEFEAINREEKIVVASAQKKYSKNVFPFMYIKHDGRTKKIGIDGNTIVGLAFDPSKVIAVSDDDPWKPAIILPAIFKVGSTWIVNPEDNHSCVGKVSLSCVKHFSTFTNKRGRKYSDVIVISGKTSFTKRRKPQIYKMSCYVYLAKGIGIVEATIDDSYNLSFNRISGTKNGTSEKANFTISRKDK